MALCTSRALQPAETLSLMSEIIGRLEASSLKMQYDVDTGMLQADEHLKGHEILDPPPKKRLWAVKQLVGQLAW